MKELQERKNQLVNQLRERSSHLQQVLTSAEQEKIAIIEMQGRLNEINDQIAIAEIKENQAGGGGTG